MPKTKTATAPAVAPVVVKTPPNIDVLERRLQNPFGEGSTPIRLKEPGWTLHVINSSLRPGRYHDVTRNKGWVPVEAKEIDGDPLDFGFDVRDGRVVRGERGQEVLVKMPTEWAEQIAARKDELNKRHTGRKAVRQAAIDAAAKEHGDEAADLIDRTIEFKAERAPVPLEPGDEQV